MKCGFGLRVCMVVLVLLLLLVSLVLNIHIALHLYGVPTPPNKEETMASTDNPGRQLGETMYIYIRDAFKELESSESDHVVRFKPKMYNDFVQVAGECVADEDPEMKLCLIREHSGGDIVAIGDLHGSLADALLIADAVEHAPASTVFVFLGDYTDRGANGPAVLALVLALRCMHPDNVLLLRGNHENARVNSRYGFAEQAQEISPDTLSLISASVYARLPQCLRIDDLFFVHGGPPIGEFEPPEDLFNLPLQYRHPKSTGLLWSDPKPGLNGTAPNKRGAGLYYGASALGEWCNSMGIHAVFRGHEVVRGGFRVDFDQEAICKHYTVFSSKSNKGPGAYVVIHRGEPMDADGRYKYEVITLTSQLHK